MRSLVAWYPDWPAVAAGYPPDVAAAVIHANRVVAATEAAREHGVHPGLRRREAQGRCPALVIVAADAGRDARAWEPVVAALESLTPAVEVLGPGVAAFATRGPSRYFGGDEALALRALEEADRVVGYRGCRVGVAGGRFCASLAARLGDGAGGSGRAVVVEPGASRAWLSSRPVGALGSQYEALVDLLIRLGIRTLGDLADLPAKAVLGRFGAEGAEAHRLARGLDDRPLAVREPPPDLCVAAELEPPAERVETAAFAAKALADELHRRLAEAGLAPAVVIVEAETEHGERLSRRWRHDGVLSASALAERVRWQLEGWLAGPRADEGDGLGEAAGGLDGRGAGGVEGPGNHGRPTGGLALIRLTPEGLRTRHGHQLGFWGGVSDSDARAGRSLARVQGMLGAEAVVTAVIAGGRAPDDAIRLLPWEGGAIPAACDRPPPGAARGAHAPGVRRRDRHEEPPPWPGRLADPSPATVHSQRPGAQVQDGAGRPVAVSARGLLSGAPAALSVNGGAWQGIVAWAGPWPLEERWWDTGRRRARLQVLLDSGEAHLVTREAGRWWIEATYS